jgi:hypothetical protein
VNLPKNGSKTANPSLQKNDKPLASKTANPLLQKNDKPLASKTACDACDTLVGN